ncbi:hypothetical protein [uncultured Micrococcus sp.]|uniref:hypothetical protein n=1 Tax=uncultured Micrococcus sp. TaxID=114051 RepID=UPI0025D90253|nr:hypothetical protein [uncultured Micrococcus sp.]
MSTSATEIRPYGPGSVPSLTPGRRGSVMLTATGADTSQALANTLPWVEAFEADCGIELHTAETALYALAPVEHLATTCTPRDPEDKAVGVSHYLDAILINGAWKVRGENPQAWAAEYRRALEQAPAGTLCTVWDVFPRR